MSTRLVHSIRLATALGMSLAMLATSVQAQEIIKRGAVTGFKVAPGKNNSQIDFVNAKPLALPRAPESAAVQAEQDLITNLVNRFQSAASTEEGGQVEGYEGDGETNAVELGIPSAAFDTQEGLDYESAQFGTSNLPFSTARADLSSPTNTMYPYRASGRLFIQTPTGSGTCTASLIKRGVVVTAAHCVSKFGTRQVFTNVSFVPGYRNGSAPYGVWTASTVWVMTAYLNGTSGQCVSTAPGVVCKDDVAVVELAPKSNPTFPGTSTGWYGFWWNRSGFTSSGLTHVTQIGYPGALDGGVRMQRNDAQGFIASSSLANNTIIGSLMTPGSSGGPWLNNFGFAPSLSGTSFGSFATPNMVTGVTSWVNSSKKMGASPFTSSNIVLLINSACANSDPRCQ